MFLNRILPTDISSISGVKFSDNSVRLTNRQEPSPEPECRDDTKALSAALVSSIYHKPVIKHVHRPSDLAAILKYVFKYNLFHHSYNQRQC